MKILFVGWGLVKASGVTTFVEHVAEELRWLGHAVDVVDVQKQQQVPSLDGYDIAHFHCLWKLHAYAVAAKNVGLPAVYSTHGMTAPWSMKHKWWKKLPAWMLFQKRDLKDAAIIHCTTEQESGWNKRLGLKKCFVAPLGTSELVASRQSLAARDERTLLFVGRIYPVKGLANLIKAWKMAVAGGQLPAAREWKLRIVGPDEAGHRAELVKLVAELGMMARVDFAGPRFGDELSAEYENCDCLVLPSFTENFGATIADAMAHGKPVIASTFTPWKIVQECKCGWWVSNEPERLALCLREMMSLSVDERMEMGVRGRKLVEERYSWGAVAKAVEDVYFGVVKGAK